MKEMNIAPVLAGAILREHIGGTHDICFQETRISEVHQTGRKGESVLVQLDNEERLQDVSRKLEYVEGGCQDEELGGCQDEEL